MPEPRGTVHSCHTELCTELPGWNFAPSCIQLPDNKRSFHIENFPLPCYNSRHAKRFTPTGAR